MKKSLLLLLFLFVCAPVRADIMVLRDGSETEGSFSGMAGGTLSFITEQGVTISTPEAGALKVLFVERRENVAGYCAEPETEAAALSTATAAEFDREAAANWLRQYTYTLGANGSAERSVKIVRKLFLEEGRDAVGNARFFYNAGYEQAGLKYAFSLNGSTAAFTDATTVVDGTEEPDFPQYNFYSSVKFSIPKVVPGAVAEYLAESTVTRISPEFPFFDRVPLLDRYPCRELRIDVTVPDIPDMVLLSSATDGWALVKTTAPAAVGFRREIWTLRDTPAKVRKAKYMPVLCFGAQDTWDNIGAYFSARIDALLKTDTLAMPRLKKGLSEARRAAELYQWVADKVVFAPVGMSRASYVPQSAQATLARGTGNTLDKPFALYALLLKAGIKARLVYADTRQDPQFFPEIPSIRQTEEAVIVAELDGKTVWLAPLETDNPFGYLPPRLQDCHGLVVHGETAGELVRTPLAEPEACALSETAVMTLDASGRMTVRSTVSVTGQYDADWRRFRHETAEEQRKEVEADLNASAPGAVLKTFRFRGLNRLAEPLSLETAYELADYALSAAGVYMAFRVPGVEKNADNAVLENRDTELDLQSRERTALTAEIICPPGYTVYYMPPPLELAGPYGSYMAVYKKTANGIRLEETLAVTRPRIPPAEYPQYRDFARRVAEYSRGYVVLRKKAGG